jgi:DNA-binding transcriptional LysR family regulator
MNNFSPAPNDALYGPRPDGMGDITLKQVRGFLAANQCSSFRQAAPLVFLSHAAFFRVIQELESALGEALFIRSGHGIKLSAAGEAFLPHAQRLMACYSATLVGMAKWRAASKGHFVLAGSRIIMPSVMPTLLSRMRNNVNAPSLLFEEGTSQQVIASVLQGHADCGLCNLLVDEPELNCVTLLSSPLGILASPDFAWPASICTLADLDGINLARYSDASVVSQVLQQHATRFAAYYNSRIMCDHMAAAYAMVQDGQVAAITSGVGASHPQARGLRFVPLPDLLPALSVSLISKRDTPLSDQQTLLTELTRVCVLEASWHASVVRCEVA